MKRLALCLAGLAGVVVGSGVGCSNGPKLGDTTARDGFTQNGRVYFEVVGSGPAVILLHGGQMDRRIWDEQVELLRGNHRVVRCDLRGFGRSPASTQPYANWEDVAQVMDDLGIEQADVVGLSLGGQTAAELAIMRPGRVRRLLLAAPGMGGFDWSEEMWTEMPPIFAAAREGNSERVTELWMNAGMMQAARDNSRCATRVRELVRENAGAWQNDPKLERELDPRDMARLKEIRAKTLVMVGDRDVPDMQRLARTIAREIPGARLVVVTGVGHIVNMEAPEKFNAEMLAFVNGP